MAKEPSHLVYDALADFSQGMNSGLDPFLIPKNQLAFAVNATVRGNFVTNRPAYQVITPSFGTKEVMDGFLLGLFQGACYYAPDSGQQQIVTQINGRLFAFTPSTSGFSGIVSEVTVPGDPNDSGLSQAWLRQAEKWVIVNNGKDLPIFYDGTTSRRSIVVPVAYATEWNVAPGDQFVTPAINGTVNVIMAAPYTGIVNSAMQVIEFDSLGIQTANTTYVVVAVGGTFTTYNVTLKNIGDFAGATQGANSDLIIQPSALGNAQSVNVTVGTPYRASVTLSITCPSSALVGMHVSISGDAGWIIESFQNSRTKVLFKYSTNVVPVIPSIGDLLVLQGTSQPNVVAGTLQAPFTAPAEGSTVNSVLIGAYTSPIGQSIYINNKQYIVTAYNPVVTTGSPNVTLQNLNDSRTGHVFNDPATSTATQIKTFPELPIGRMGTYGMGRWWESLTDGISFMSGDIVGGSSGSPAYNFRDAVLKASENDLLNNGGSFHVPSNLGIISAMQFTAQLDASLGQGPLMVVTPRGVFSCNASPDRSVWSQTTSPIVSESLIGLGGLSQNSTIVCNGDLIFRSVDGIRSLIMARRDFWSWGNAPISFEMDRVLSKDNVEGLPYGSAVQFDNRLLETCSPVQGPQGIYNQGLIALNFDPVSTIQGKGPSVYDGLWTGLNVLQVLEGQFSGVHRCFAITYSSVQQEIQIYEILKTGNLDNGTAPITWSFESPVLFKSSDGKNFFELISIEDGEFYISDVKPGEKAHIKVELRPDFSNCWYPWHEFDYCNSTTSTVPIYGDRLGLGRPPSMNTNNANFASANFGRWFQVRFTFTGHCVFKGARIMASLQPQSGFARVTP